MKTFILLLLILIAGCKKEPANVSEKIPDKDPAAANSEQVEENSNAENNSVNDQKPIGNVQYAITGIPGEIKYQGTIIAMAKWKDALGDNVVFVTETSEVTSEDSRSKELFGYHYIIDKDGVEQLWKINDFVKDCPLDLTLRYMDRSLEITDLDSNGTAESSFLYRLACKGDVSSDDMKLLMHEGKEKYAIRGIMDITLNGEPFQKGEMNIDPSYKNAPEVFSEYSKARWDKFKTDRIGN